MSFTAAWRERRQKQQQQAARSGETPAAPPPRRGDENRARRDSTVRTSASRMSNVRQFSTAPLASSCRDTFVLQAVPRRRQRPSARIFAGRTAPACLMPSAERSHHARPFALTKEEERMPIFVIDSKNMRETIEARPADTGGQERSCSHWRRVRCVLDVTVVPLRTSSDRSGCHPPPP